MIHSPLLLTRMSCTAGRGELLVPELYTGTNFNTISIRTRRYCTVLPLGTIHTVQTIQDIGVLKLAERNGIG